MVCLNPVISFDKLKLQNNLIEKITGDVENNFYLYKLDHLKLDSKIKTEITVDIVKNVNKIIKESIKNSFSNDYFIYVNMDDNLCVHKFKKGNKEGYFCCKKITKNGDKNNYVCTKHNKDHKPKKRKNKNLKISKICENNNKHIDLDINKKIVINNNRNRIFKKKLKNNKKNKKIFICNSGLIDFKKIFKDIL